MRKIVAIILLIFLVIGAVCGYENQRIQRYTEFSKLTNGAPVVVFAAYSADGTVADYVVSYLQKLKSIAPNIIFVTDNKIRRADIRKLKPFVNILVADRHEEYDWGSYKRGINILYDKGMLSSIPQLILANDSTLPVVPSLKPIIDKAQSVKADVFGVSANTDGIYHLQSYFLVFQPKVFNHSAFISYFNQVTKQKDGLSVAYRYEVPFTKYLQDLGFTVDTYIPYDELSYLPLNDKNCYPLTLLSKYNAPLLKMRTFTNRLTVQEPRRLVFLWLKKHNPEAYRELIEHLKHIESPYLKEIR